MHKIGVFFTDITPNGKPFTSPEYLQSYQELTHEATQQLADFYIVRGIDSYSGKGHFTNSWQFQSGQLVETGPVTLGALYDKDRFFTFNYTDIPLFNPAEVSHRCIDKSWIFTHFPEACPKTYLVRNQEELRQKMNTITAERVVVKPPNGSEGAGVQVLNTSELLGMKLSYPCLVQDFLDSSNGIPGIIEGIHDLRIALFNGEPFFSFLRTPPGESLIANIAQGGLLTLLPVHEIPAEALALATMVDQKMQDFSPRFYSVDMMLTPNGWRLIELESSLGLQENSRGAIFQATKKHIISALISLCE